MIITERGRFILLASASLLVLGAMVFWSMTQGTVTLTGAEILAALSGNQGASGDMARTIILELRLPRALLAVMAGAGLAVTGALLQTTTRNELADPFLFGLSSGASAGAVFVITRFGDVAGVATLPLAAFAGGILSAAGVLLLFRLCRQQRAEHLIICGLAISFLSGALTSYLVFSGDQRAASAVLFWTLGGLGLARLDNLWLPLAALLLLAGFILWRWRGLDGLLAGELTARSMGINVSRLRTETFICCALVTALLVALTGVIGFIGLIIPHIARRCGGVRHLFLLPLCALMGAILLCGGDIISRTLIPHQELPVGIITAAMGGVFIILIFTRR